MSYRARAFADFLSHCDGLSGASALVVGCGRGLDCQPFFEAGAAVTGLDIRDDIGADFPQASYRRGSIEDSRLPANSFDAVFALATIEHVHAVDWAFQEMVRVTKPGGLIFSLAAPLWFSRDGHHLPCLEPYPWIHLRMSPKELADFAAERGILHAGQPLAWSMDFLFRSSYFNRLPAGAYAKAVDGLPVSRVIRNYFWPDEQDPREYPGLARYPVSDLVSRSHSFIARK